MLKTNFKYALKRVGLPLIITNNEPHLCLLIDTGSTHNILFSFVLEAYPELFNLMNVETFNYWN